MNQFINWLVNCKNRIPSSAELANRRRKFSIVKEGVDGADIGCNKRDDQEFARVVATLQGCGRGCGVQEVDSCRMVMQGGHSWHMAMHSEMYSSHRMS